MRLKDLNNQCLVITGGSGLLGSYIIKQFLKEKFDVVAIDKKKT